jgi:predicted nucleotidyltransferase
MIRKADWRLAERLKGSLLEHNIPLYKLIVFGSRARGDAGPESDLDVLVLVEHVDAVLRKTISHCA